jgi:hypothetical protein
MISIWKPALFFVFCLLITLLLNMPAGYPLARVEFPQQIKISQLEGSLLKGQVGGLSVKKLVIEDLEYKFDISCLITVSLCYRLNFTDGSMLVKFVPISGSLEISRLDAELSMANLAGLTDQLLVKPAGNLHLISDKLIFEQGKLADIDAIAVWKNAGIAGEDIDLGDYQLNIARQNQQYLVYLVDKEAVLDVEGKGELKPDGRYSLDININARSGLDANVKNALDLVASKKGLRQYNIRRTGVLDKNLLSYLAIGDD